MKRFFSIYLLISFWGTASFATHIVGGEFEMLHLDGDRYLFRQIQYFDVINGNPQAKDIEIVAYIFRKKDNAFVRSVLMQLQSENYVPYTNPDCTYDKLITNRLVYSAEINLNPRLFSDPEGYYMVWERCCRNNIINNIIKPDETGQTFYLEFPPISKDGIEYRNSSPQLFPPLSDYACVNRLYYVDFRGSDPDGDSLVYSLVAPLNSSEFNPLPTPTPAPHPLVNWTSGIDINNQIPGNPTLKINSNGFLTVTPTREGLFVFSVKCEEYRNGSKIGEVRRDFQLFVIDCPDPGLPPKIVVKPPGRDVFLTESDTIRLKIEDLKCFDFKIKDQDGSETVAIKAVPVNFEGDLQDIFSVNIGRIETDEDSLEVQMCLPDCPYLRGEPLIIDVIAQDFTCPLPLSDTVRLVVYVEAPPNRPPKFTLPIQKEITAAFTEGTIIHLDFAAEDPDLDSLLLTIDTDGFDLSQFGIEIDTAVSALGNMAFSLNWNTDCSVYPFSLKSDFQIKLYVEDLDQCALVNRDSIILNIHIDLPSNNSPIVLVDNDNADKELNVHIEDNLIFDIRAFDADPADTIILSTIGLDFNPTDIGINFESQKGTGTIRTKMQWQIDCDDVELFKKNEYELLIIVDDKDKCKLSNADTVKLKLKILPPLNNPPEIFVNGERSQDTVRVTAGKLLELDILGIDVDGDLISFVLSETEKAHERGVDFEQKSGKANINTNFVWQTDCSMLEDNFQDATYSYTVILQDYKCLVPLSDSFELVIVIEDDDVNYNFLPPNVFTPNEGDRINEAFYIPDLPVNNCAQQFKGIEIYNRWGKKMFSSGDRDFRWNGENAAEGVYYYLVSYTDFSVKGTLTILR